MAIRYAIEQHASAFPSKVLAREGGKHIYNIEISEDVDQGWFVGKGAFLDLDLYEEAAPTSFSGKVVKQAANGNWYVEVIKADNALFVYSVPMIEEEYNRSFQKEENFFNQEGDVVRAYELAPGDIIEISTAGFKAEPSVDDSVSLQAIAGVALAMQLG